MDTSIFLAQLIGPVFVVIALAMMLRMKNLTALMRSFVSAQDQPLMFISGTIALIAGIAMVLVHNIWDGTWRVLITLLAWLTVGKGIVRLFAPRWAHRTANTFANNKTFMQAFVVFLLLVGLYLSYRGFLT